MPRQRHPIIENAVECVSNKVPGDEHSFAANNPDVIAEAAVEVFGAYQKAPELTPLLEELFADPPRTVVEIGTLKGGTLFGWCQVATPDAIIGVIDLPEGPHGGGFSLRDEFRFARFKQSGQRIRYLRRDSHDQSTRDDLVRSFDGTQIDFLFIDGDHSEEGVRQDWEMYGSLVRPGGRVAFHDIVHHQPRFDCHVDKLWEELKRDFLHQEFIYLEEGDDREPWGGIGVLRV